jgi:Protein of unknown function (DUF2934)
MQELEHAIHERAYQLWTESGCQDGQATAHWLAAQREVLSSSLGAIARVTVTDQQPKKVAKAGASRRKPRAAYRD